MSRAFADEPDDQVALGRDWTNPRTHYSRRHMAMVGAGGHVSQAEIGLASGRGDYDDDDDYGSPDARGWDEDIEGDRGSAYGGRGYDYDGDSDDSEGYGMFSSGLVEAGGPTHPHASDGGYSSGEDENPPDDMTYSMLGFDLVAVRRGDMGVVYVIAREAHPLVQFCERLHQMNGVFGDLFDEGAEKQGAYVPGIVTQFITQVLGRPAVVRNSKGERLMGCRPEEDGARPLGRERAAPPSHAAHHFGPGARADAATGVLLDVRDAGFERAEAYVRRAADGDLPPAAHANPTEYVHGFDRGHMGQFTEQGATQSGADAILDPVEGSSNVSPVRSARDVWVIVKLPYVKLYFAYQELCEQNDMALLAAHAYLAKDHAHPVFAPDVSPADERKVVEGLCDRYQAQLSQASKRTAAYRKMHNEMGALRELTGSLLSDVEAEDVASARNCLRSFTRQVDAVMERTQQLHESDLDRVFRNH